MVNDIRVASVVPLEPVSSHQIKDIGFKVNFSAPFHRIGTFVNALENGPLTIRMRRLELGVQSRGSSMLNVNAEGTAYILPQKYFE
jgi:Tfp pilus assembly protein PilO